MANSIEEEKKLRAEKIISNSKIASDTMRKIVGALLVSVFGLAFEQSKFDFSSLYLKFSLISLVVYLSLDMLQFIAAVYCAQVRIIGDKLENSLIYVIFYSKFIFAFLGLILILIELYVKYEK